MSVTPSAGRGIPIFLGPDSNPGRKAEDDGSEENLVARELSYKLHIVTRALANCPLYPDLFCERSKIYQEMGYHDLAAADAYYMLTLVETMLDPDFSDLQPSFREGEQLIYHWLQAKTKQDQILNLKLHALGLLIENLAQLGCLQDACTFYVQAREIHVRAAEHFSLRIPHMYHELRPEAPGVNSVDEILAKNTSLPNQGLSRREVFPWNTYEPDRTALVSVNVINEQLNSIAPNIEARATELPILTARESPDPPRTNLQLGLFARKDLPPSTTILRERSTITAIRPIDASLCDLCASPLPSLSSPNPPIPCPGCHTTIFCSQSCLSYAATTYHQPPFCDNEDGLEEIGRDSNSSTPADDLYFLLIARTIAMAETLNVHPLDLVETKYLCGEFVPHAATSAPSLPFSFRHNVLLPFRFFTTLMLSDESVTPYSAHWMQKYDHWVIQTLYAKFRGVASARQSTWDARPEVAAVHPLWCLANHSCNPNVRWSWGPGVDENGQDEGEDGEGKGEIVFKVRDGRVWERPGEHGEWEGIKQGEEIMNHYVDVDLGVTERREYAMGPLGGICRCERCVVESGEKKENMR